MTEYAIPPIMLTSTESTSALRKRSSIRRGTIASICKDVRVKDVEEIIKKQKALQQQERNTETDSILLKRRHSMMNMNKSIFHKPQQQKQDHRNRTLSNSDLKGTAVWQQTKQQQQQQQQQQQTETDKIRLGEDQGVLYQHLRKCAACLNNNECFSSEQEEEEEEENSPSPSTSSSSNDQDTFAWQQKPSSLLHSVEQREQIIKDLNSSMTSYSGQIKELSNGCCNEQEYKSKIEHCKSLVAQQELLLNQLYYQNNSPSSSSAAADDIVPKTAPTPSLEKNNNSSTFIQSICNDLYKGFKSTTTGITIKQKQDKNEADTIISVQGVCTTVERNLIPDTLLDSPDQPSSVYQHQYSLDITHADRQTKFKLLLQDQWQKDVKVNACSFKDCNTQFNWFQRKHHCRACGEIYCNTHSGNRLPLFSAKETLHPVFSRVCDTCFYSLANHSLH
ncbi:hypothetical protein MFLAVUS_001349 [Mucor flavus]|uniref:FYVE-type domain-containing protein n=1 Tax=Mucor flavus TaxID=439312 RepID=A0ABP9YM69_9FUNG